MSGDPADDADRPAVTGAPIGDTDARRAEAITGDDATGEDGGNPYPTDGVSPDRGSSAPRDRA